VSKRNAVQQAFDRFGQEAGFEKRSGSWYRHGEEVISISNLQKSQYGAQYYVNQGFWLRQLADVRYPKSNEAHIATRLEDLMLDAEEEIGMLLDLERELPDQQRIDELNALLNQRLLPLIERGGSIAGLRSMVDGGTLAGAGISGPAQEALGILAR
jgi:hypothetical protein